MAANGTVVEAGGVYLTYSGDPETPYTFAKIVGIGGTGASMGVQLGPDLRPVLSPDLWIKLVPAYFADRPNPPVWPTGSYRVMPISVAMFLAWGPPTFPIRVGTEPVTDAELAARGGDWVGDPPPRDSEGTEASLILTGPLSAADERNVFLRLPAELWRELRDLLVDEDVELRWGSTKYGDDPTVMEARIHFRVRNVEAALGIVRQVYTASGLMYPATVRVHEPDSDEFATHPIAAGASRHAGPGGG